MKAGSDRDTVHYVRAWPWPNADDPEWNINMTLQMLEGRLQPVALSIEPSPGHDPRPINGTVLRSIPLAAIARSATAATGAAKKASSVEGAQFVAALPSSKRERLAKVKGNIDRKESKSNDKRDLSFYVFIADLYGDAADYSRHPAQLMADVLEVKHATARTWIRRARERGLIRWPARPDYQPTLD